MLPPEPKHDYPSLRQIIEEYHDVFSRECIREIRETGLYSHNMSEQALGEVCHDFIEAILDAIEDKEDDFVDWAAKYLRLSKDHYLPYSEVLSCLRKLRSKIRDRLNIELDLPPEALSRIDRLDEGVDKLRTTFLNQFIAKQEQRFRIVFEQSSVGKAFVDADGRVLAFNAALRELLGYSDDELFEGLGKVFENERDRELFESCLEPSILSGNGGACLESELRHKSGESRWAKISTAAVGERDRKAGMLLVMFQDVTGHKRAEKELFERVKELEGLYGLGRLIDEKSDLETILKTFINEVVPASMQHPEHVAASVELDGKFYANRPETPAVFLSAPIEVDSKPRGELVVGYDREQEFIPGFENRLVEEYAERLGLMVERMETRRALAASEEKFRRLAENARDMIYRMSLPDGRYEYVSPACKEVMGHPPEKFYDNPMFIAEIIAPEFEEYLRGEWENILNGVMAPVYEYKVIAADGEEKWLSQRNVLIRDEDGAPAAMEGVVTDVTERRRTEEELRRNERALSMGQRIANFGNWIRDLGSAEAWWSDQTYRIFGYEPGEVELSLEFLKSRIVPEDRAKVENVVAEAFAGEESFGFDYRIIRKDGEVRHIRTNGIIEHEEKESGGPLLHGVLHDVTERKQAEAELEETVTMLRETGEMARVGGWKLYPETMRVVWTEETYRIHELPPEHEPPLEEAVNFYHPEDRPILKRAIDRALKYGEPYDLQLRFITAKGRELWVRSVCEPVIEDGKVVLLRGTFQDITERKLADQKLRYNLALLEAQQEASPDGIVFADPSQRMLSWNRRFMEMWDLDERIMLSEDGEKALESVREKLIDPEAFIQEIIQLNREPEQIEHGKEVELEDGRVLERYSQAVLDADGTFWGRVWHYHDITERKRAVEALRESEKRYRALFESIRDSILVADTDRKIVHCNQAFTELFGYELEEIQGKKTSFIYESEEEFQRLGKELQKHPPGENFIFLVHYEKKSGEVFPGETNVFYLKNDRGEVTGFIGLIRNVTERKRAEEELRRTNERLLEAQRIGRMGDWEWDPEKDRVNWSEQLYHIMGLEAEEPPPSYEGQLDLYHPESAERLDRAVKLALEKGAPYELELSRTRPDGRVIHVLARGEVEFADDGNVSHLYGAVQDITERKRAEERLKHRAFELEMLHTLSRKIGFTLDYGQLLQLLLSNLHQVLEYDVAASLLDREGSLEMTLQCALPVTDGVESDIRERLVRTIRHFNERPVDESRLSMQTMECRPGDLEGHETLDEMNSTVVVPLFTSAKRAAGAILIAAKQENAFGEEQVRLLFTLADLASESVQRLRDLLAEEEKALVQLLEAMPEGVLLLDEDLNIEVSNANAQAMLRDISGNLDMRRFSNVTDTPLTQAVDGRLKDGGRMEFASQEDEAVFDVWSTPLEHGPYAGGWVLIIRDVTSDRLAREALRRSEEKFRTLFDSSGDAIFVHDLHGNFLDVNEQACKRLGYSREELLNMAPADIDSPEYRPKTSARLEKLKEEGYIFFETEHVREDGGKVPTEITARVIDYEGMSAVLSTARNITERKKAEEAVKEREQLLQSMLKGIRAAFFIVDKETLAVVEANQMGQELLGLDKKEIVGRHCPEVLDFSDVDHVCTGGDGERAVLSQEHVLKRKDGRSIPVSLSLLEMNIKGRPYYVFICFDISERKNLERRLSLAQKLESVGQLAAGIAHEINTPIQFIANNVDFLKEACNHYEEYVQACESAYKTAEDDAKAIEALRKAAAGRDEPKLEFYMEESKKAIEEAREGIERITGIVGSIKKFSHPGGLGASHVDLNEAIESTMTVARNEWKYNSEMELELDPDLPQIKGYPAEINQALLNLVVNAAHAVAERFSDSEEKGEIMIRTYAENDKAVVVVKDNGTGIPEGLQSRIFDPFFTTKEVGKGTGQGLAIVHSVVVDKHGGELDLVSEPGAGTTFTIRLPFSPPEGRQREQGGTV
jgi:PAS domain S-box-containing protein